MNNTDVFNALHTAHIAGLSVLIKGTTGIGKTEMVRAYAYAVGMKLVHIHAPLEDALTLKGVISAPPDAFRARFLPVDIWPNSNDAPVVVLIDELPQALITMQNGFSQLLIDHQVGNMRLPKGSLVVATGNRREDKAAINAMPSHVTNRVLHIEVLPSADSFINFCLRGADNVVSLTTEQVQAAYNGLPHTLPMHPSIVGYVQFRPSNIHTLDKHAPSEPYASYRSYSQLNRLMAASEIAHSGHLLLDFAEGVLGKAVAVEFMGFRRTAAENLPDPRKFIDDVDSHGIPTSPDILYALLSAVATVVDANDFDKCGKLINKLESMKLLEFGIVLVKMLKMKFGAQAPIDGVNGAKIRDFMIKYAPLVVGSND